MDSPCPCPLAVIGRAVLPPGLAERVRRMEGGEMEGAEAMAVRAEVQALAALLRSSR